MMELGMERRRFLTAALAVPAVAFGATSASAAPAFAPPFSRYNPEAAADLLDAGGVLVILLARQGCSNPEALDAARYAIHTAADTAPVSALEAPWEEVASLFEPEGEQDPGPDGVRLVIYHQGAVHARLMAHASRASTSADLREALAPVLG